MVDPTQTEFKHVEKSVTEGRRIRFLKDFQAKRGRAGARRQSIHTTNRLHFKASDDSENEIIK